MARLRICLIIIMLCELLRDEGEERLLRDITDPVRLASFFSGCIGDWIYRTLGGIDQLEPAYRKIRIAPKPDGKLSFATASYKSVHGEIAVSWEIKGGTMTVSAKVPGNTTAVVRLPGATLDKVTEGGNALLQAEGIALAKQDGKDVEFEAGSGDFVFTYSL